MNFNKDIESCLHVLQSGGVILYPTDTVWGLGCDATNKEAVSRIYKIKNRADSKALVVLAKDEEMVSAYTTALDKSVFPYLESTTKPTTVIYKNGKGFAGNLIATDGSIAIRICKEPFCQKLLEVFQKPIVSTSANLAGDNTPPYFSEINRQLIATVDFVVNYRQQDKTPFTASTIIKWQNGKPLVIRA